MSWQTEILPRLRSLISDDIVGSYTYDNDRLLLMSVNAASFVNDDLGLSSTYTVAVQTTGISPDPATEGDYSFLNLTALRAACMIAGSEAKTLQLGGVRVTDGPSTIDLSGAAREAGNRYKSACEEYAKAKLNYLMNIDSPGHVIFSASRTVESVCPDNLQ